MAGAGISGKDGDVKIGTTSICEIRKWSFNPKSNNPAYASNKTGGYKKRVAGVKDGTGSMEGAWDPATPATAVINPGTSATLKLYINATQFYSVPSIIDSFKLDVDVDSGEIVGWSADFGSDGAWTDPTTSMTLPEGIAPEGASPDGEEGNWQFAPAGGLQSDDVPTAPAAEVPAATVQQIVEAVTANVAQTLSKLTLDIETLRAQMSAAASADPATVA